MIADQADPQVQPLPANPQAILAAFDRGRQLADGDLVQMATNDAHRASRTEAVRARCAWTNWTAIAPFANGGGAPFRRPGADVAGREHAGNIGLEEVVHVRCRAGDDEAVVVAADGVVEPLGARTRTEEKEHERERNAFAARERDGREVPIFAVERGDLAPISNGDAVPLELVDEVVRHRLAEVRARWRR